MLIYREIVEAIYLATLYLAANGPEAVQIQVEIRGTASIIAAVWMLEQDYYCWATYILTQPLELKLDWEAGY